MGFLKHLLFWPVTGPAYLARFSLEKVQGVVREELTDESRVKEELLDLQLRMELGDVDEETYVEEEARLMGELREVRRWREEFGMGSRGGVVRMGREEPAPADAEAEAGAVEGEETPDAAVPGGVTLEVTLDWDEEEEEP